MDIRMNNTNTKFEVWVNIYLADFFWDFQIFWSEKNQIGTIIKLENGDSDIVDLEVLLFNIIPCKKEVIKKHK